MYICVSFIVFFLVCKRWKFNPNRLKHGKEFTGTCKSRNSRTHQLQIWLDPRLKWCLQNSVFFLCISPLCCLHSWWLASHVWKMTVTSSWSSMPLCWNPVKKSEHLYSSISRKHSGVHSDWTKYVHVLIFDLITHAIRMKDFGWVWVIHPILELKMESTPLEEHELKVREIGV